MNRDEGYIKFNLNWKEKTFDFSDNEFTQLNLYRNNLVELGLIGLYPDGIGFGNISIRQANNRFIISGSATGGIKNLTKEHYALVTEYNLQNNHVICKGLTKASSESMSHAAIYQSNTNVNAVIHIHHQKLWEKLIHVLPTTDKKAEFGTPEMAFEISKLSKTDLGIIIMGGHPEGIISYGKNLEEAYTTLIKHYNEL